MRARTAVAAALMAALAPSLVACASGGERHLEVLVPPGTVASSEPPQMTATTLAPARTGPAPGAEWLDWRPTYRDVRRADPAGLAEIGNRVTARNASEWTATDVLRGIELAFTPTHVRALIPRAGLFFRVRPGGPRHSYVVCTDDGCVDGGRDAVTLGPENDNAYLAQVAAYVRAAVAEQTRTAILRRQGPTRLATVRSPGGRLDCVLHAEDAALLRHLDGKAVGTRGVVTRCVDRNGLVVPLDLGLPPGGWSPLVEGVTGEVRIPSRYVGLYTG